METSKNKKLPFKGSFEFFNVAERAGFEPAVQLPAHTLSKRAL